MALVIAALPTMGIAATAAPILAPLFQDHAVLQREKPVPIWGHASPGEHVSVSFAGQTVGTTAGPDGRWIAVLTPLAASVSGSDLTASGKATTTLHDILVGEVWLCSGQSGMESMIDDGGTPKKADSAAEIAAARHPLVRQFKVERQASPIPMETALGEWAVCAPETAGRFTAVGYFFARDLSARLGVPIGLINSTWEGSTLEAWMSPAALAASPGAHPVASAGPGRGDFRGPSALFNGMIHPLLPYAIRGAVWYDGEGGEGRASAYAAQFPALITAWRAHFGEGDFPFLWVQLAASRSPAEVPGGQWARFREAQSGALVLPSTGQVVTMDIVGAGSARLRGMREVGRRLALVAKAKAYSIPVDYSGPVFSRADLEGSAIRVHFLFAGEGLTASGKPLQSFELAGADRTFRAASAVIQGDTVVVRSPAVAQPIAVRYGWRNAPDANLFNGAGLPAAPFRSDDW
jgi:sialate O-acetylesterase